MRYKLLMESGVSTFNKALEEQVLLGWTPLPESMNTVFGGESRFATHSILLQKPKD